MSTDRPNQLATASTTNGFGGTRHGSLECSSFNELETITDDVIEAAASILVIGN
ncbi:MAG: hypothetical protein ACRDNO_17945 [Trebonia sp.]